MAASLADYQAFVVSVRTALTLTPNTEVPDGSSAASQAIDQIQTALATLAAQGG